MKSNKKEQENDLIRNYFSNLGKKSSSNMTVEQRSERARSAALKRWSSKKKS